MIWSKKSNIYFFCQTCVMNQINSRKLTTNVFMQLSCMYSHPPAIKILVLQSKHESWSINSTQNRHTYAPLLLNAYTQRHVSTD